MKLFIAISSLFLVGNVLAAQSVPETRGRIVCTVQFDNEAEEGRVVVVEQISTLYNDGSEVKHMQGTEFMDENFKGRSPIFEARLFYIDGKLGKNPTEEFANSLIRNATPTFERFGQMGRIRDSIRYSFGHNGSGTERVIFNLSTLRLDRGVVIEVNGTKESPKALRCMKPYTFEVPAQQEEFDSDGEIIMTASES